MEKSIKIKSLQCDERPREKMMEKGASSLSNAELLALVIGTGYADKSALELSRDILEMHERYLHRLSQLNLDEWMQIKGIGPSKAAVLHACFELARRRRQEQHVMKKSVTCSKDAFEYLLPFLGDLRHEEFWILLLNRSNTVIGIKRVSEGGLSSTLVDPKKVFGMALQQRASGMILAHNHPSGALYPSDEDRVITRRLRGVGIEMELKVLDHLIIHANAYFSFADEGILEL
ncbi:MAG: DNA repair protein RadC [Bacteroidetes bacterium]|nr:DNA repair protein RadC [Bacteroidota bacterium]